MNAALLILRMVLGLGLASHGSQKLFEWFGGGGIGGTGVFLESIGFRPGSRFALAAGLGEFLGGLLLACGFLGPIGPALIVSVMLVAILTVHKGHGFFAFSNGPELPIIYITGAVAVALAGSGYYSIDHALGLDSSFSEVAVTIILACGVLGALASLAVRHSPELAAKSSWGRFSFDAGHFRSAVDGRKHHEYNPLKPIGRMAVAQQLKSS